MADKQVRKVSGTGVKRVSRKRRYPWKDPTELQKAIYDCIAINPFGTHLHVPPDRPYYGGKAAEARRKIAYEILDALRCIRERDIVRRARGYIEHNPLLKDVFDEKIEV